MGEVVAVYSALYGDYDTAKPIDAGVPAYMFTDNPNLHAPGWTVIHRPHRIATRNGPADLVMPMLAHKYWKTHPQTAINQALLVERVDLVNQLANNLLPSWVDMPVIELDTIVTIWVDASIVLEPGFVDKALAALGDDDWAMVPHPWRTCIYTEADYSAALPRYNGLADRIRTQASFYRSIGHPEDWGLFATGVNARRHTPVALEVSEQWWHDILTHSHQDQISLPVLTRIYSDPGGPSANWSERPLRWNTNIGWMEGWQLWPHLK